MEIDDPGFGANARLTRHLARQTISPITPPAVIDSGEC